jgi:CheY-like chemotaxis protein
VSTIIVADDDPLFRAIMKRHLTRMGYTVVEDESGVEVLSQIAQYRPLACLIDIVMDEKEGLETIGAIRRLPDKPKVIAVSSNAFYLDMALPLGADATLEKPVSPEALEGTLKALGVTPD